MYYSEVYGFQVAKYQIRLTVKNKKVIDSCT